MSEALHDQCLPAEATPEVSVRALGPRLLVKPIESAKMTPGGIALPDNARDKATRGVVLVVGNGHLLQDGTRAPMDVGVGDEVMFGSYAGTEIEIDEDTLIVLKEEEILLVL